MDIIDTLLGSPTPEEAPTEPTIDLPKADYTIAYPVVIRASQLDTFQSVIKADRDTPRLDEPGADFIKDALDDAWSETMPDEQTWSERFESTRRDAGSLIEGWQAQMTADPDALFLPIDALRQLEAFLYTCEVRTEVEEDPFELPDEFMDAVSFVKSLQSAKERKKSVLIHTDQHPVPE